MQPKLTLLVTLLITLAAQAQNTASLLMSDSTFARDAANSVAYDSAGNRYVAGHFAGTLSIQGNQYVSDYGPADSFTTTTVKGYLCKFNNAGQLVWLKTFMGRGSQRCLDVEVNKNTGDCYVSGLFSTELVIDGVRQDATDGSYFNRPFVARFDANGNKQWVKTTMSTYYTDGSYSIALSPNGSYLYWHCDFIGDLQIDGSGAYNAIGGNYVLMRINTATGAITRSFQADDYLQDGYLLNSDNLGNVIWSGYHRNTGYVVNNPDFALPQGFVLKLNGALNFTPVWSFEVSGRGFQTINGTALDASGNIYIYGYYNDTTRFFNTTGTDQGVELIPVPFKTNAYVAKISRSGNLVWARQFQSDQLDVNNYDIDDEVGLTVDSRNNIFVGGSFKGTLAYGSSQLVNSNIHKEPFLIRLTPNGNISWMINPTTKYGGYLKGLAAYNTNVTAAGEIYGVGNFYPDSYFAYPPDSVTNDYNATYLWDVADCAISITTSASSQTVNASNPVTLSVTPIPNATYQWYRNNNPINNATSSVYITTRGGTYFCIVSFGPCAIRSSRVRLITVPGPASVLAGSTDNLTTENPVIGIYPNPAKDRFTLTIPATVKGQLQLRISDMGGRNLLTKSISAGTQQVILPKGTVPGIYVVQLIHDSTTYTSKLVVE